MIRRHHTQRVPGIRAPLTLLCLLLAALTGYPLGGPLGPARPVQAAAAIHLSRYQAGPGDSLAIYGTGFTPSDLVAVFVTVAVPGGTQRINTTTAVTAAGAFTAGFILPVTAAPGTYTVTARDYHARSAMASLSILPVIVVGPGAAVHTATVVANHGFYVRGVGFGPVETVRITASYPLYKGTTDVESRTVVTDRAGAFAEVLVPAPLDARVGSYQLTAVGTTSGRSGKGVVRVVYQPQIAAAQATVRPGGSLIVGGSGFVPGSRVHLSLTVAVSAGAEQLAADTGADSNGAFQAAVAIPASALVGPYTVKAVDLVGGFAASAPFRVALIATLSLQPSGVSPGQRVTISGSGFGGGVAVEIRANFPLGGGGVRSVVIDTQSTSTGTVTATLLVPAGAAPGLTTVTARSRFAGAHARLTIARLTPTILVSPPAAIPGATLRLRGAGYVAGDRVSIQTVVRVAGGAQATLSTSAIAGAEGGFTAYIRIPSTAVSGSYTLTGRSASGHTATSRFTVATLAPAIVALPMSVAPGARLLVNGFGFPADVAVGLSIQGTGLGGATTDASGRFSSAVVVPAGTASGTYALLATAGSGVKATVSVSVNRPVISQQYVSALYTGTGYHEYITMLNTTEVRARVTITYERSEGANSVKSVTVSGHSRFTEDVNADLGPKVSAAAVVAADVPISVERVVYHGSDGDVVAAQSAPATTWYFANGNTGNGYREYLALQNPGATPVQVAVEFFPAHHTPFTIYRTVAPTSRVTVKVNTFVAADAVGTVLSANGPIVANRTVFIHRGMTSTDGVRAAQRTWYFASGPTADNSRTWVAVTNPFNRWSYLKLQAYGTFGGELGTRQGWVKPYGRVGYLINSVAGQADAAVVLSASRPLVAEEMTYRGALHAESTDTFGTSLPTKSATFTAVNTAAGRGDTLDVFNPNLTPLPLVVDFVTSTGATTQRTYLIGPFYHQHIDVAGVVPNTQLGIVAASSYPFVALNRGTFASGSGGFCDSGSR